MLCKKKKHFRTLNFYLTYYQKQIHQQLQSLTVTSARLFLKLNFVDEKCKLFISYTGCHMEKKVRQFLFFKPNIYGRRFICFSYFHGRNKTILKLTDSWALCKRYIKKTRKSRDDYKKYIPDNTHLSVASLLGLVDMCDHKRKTYLFLLLWDIYGGMWNII